MSDVEEEIQKLHNEISRFLDEEGGGDSGDEDVDVAPAARARPGSITPMGVRVDRGSGLLGAHGTTATLGEMDAVLSNIRAWKQKHEREMLEMRQRSEQALAEADTNPELPAKSAQSHTDDGAAGPLLRPGSGSASCPGKRAHGGAAAAPAAAAAAAAPEEPLQLLSPPAELGLEEEEDEDLRELLRERRERQQRILSAHRQPWHPQPQRQQQAGEQTQGQQDLRLRIGEGPEGLEGRGQGYGQGLSCVPSSAAAGEGGGSVKELSACLAPPPPASMLRGSSSLGRAPHPDPLPRSGAPPSAKRPSTAARKQAEAAATAALLRGQQLLAELEAELRELEEGGSGPAGAGAAVGRGGQAGLG
ncbi:hypothetical protein Agub_g10486, partial [Astrephomene gubernaculifera]